MVLRRTDRTISLAEPDFHSSESGAVEEAKSFNLLGLKYDLNNARLHPDPIFRRVRRARAKNLVWGRD